MEAFLSGLDMAVHHINFTGSAERFTVIKNRLLEAVSRADGDGVEKILPELFEARDEVVKIGAEYELAAKARIDEN